MKSTRFDRQAPIATSGGALSSAATSEGFEARRSEPSNRFVIAALGAFASGLAALEDFFDHIPADAGIAFIVVQRVAPDHASALLEKYADSPAGGPGQCEHRSKSRPYHSAERNADHQELHAAIEGSGVIPIADRDRLRTPLVCLLARVTH
jgi:hypothetical protein